MNSTIGTIQPCVASSCFSYRQQRSWQMAARKENKPEYQSIRASDYLSVSSKKKLQQQHLISLVVTHLHVTVVCSAWGLIQPSLSPRPHPLHPQVLRREVLIPPLPPPPAAEARQTPSIPRQRLQSTSLPHDRADTTKTDLHHVV